MLRQQGRGPEAELQLPPGFRFYPTDEELVVHYLCKKAAAQPFAVPIIAEVDLYKFNPWDLPEKALFGAKEWYFFSPRDRKYPNGSRPNRAAGSGYWKATGTDKPISTLGGTKKVGVKKALVFYIGKAPKGAKTNWIMHEYRLADGASRAAKRKGSLRLDDWVLCRIYNKTSSAQKAAGGRDESGEALSRQLDDALAYLPEIGNSKRNNLPRLEGYTIEQQDVKPNAGAVYSQGQGTSMFVGSQQGRVVYGQGAPQESGRWAAQGGNVHDHGGLLHAPKQRIDHHSPAHFVGDYSHTNTFSSFFPSAPTSIGATTPSSTTTTAVGPASTATPLDFLPHNFDAFSSLFGTLERLPSLGDGGFLASLSSD